MKLNRYCWARAYSFAARTERELVACALAGSLSFEELKVRIGSRPDFAKFEQLMQQDLAQGINFTILADPDYPKSLARIPDPPLLLYYRGNIAATHNFNGSISIVGTRKPSDEYRLWSEQLARALADAGVTIVSGLALGIDGAAHRGALSSEGGRTVAYVANGLDSTYPPQHQELAQRIYQQDGVIFSQYPSGTRPLAHNFLNRNRLIAAHSIGLIVVQAGARSGSLSSARHALNLGSEVLSVPGPVADVRFEGSNKLIQQGAACVLHAPDVFDALPQLEPTRNVARHKSDRKIISECEYLQMLGVEGAENQFELLRRELLGEIKLLPNGKVEILTSN